MENLDYKIDVNTIVFLDNKKDFKQNYEGGDFFDENTGKLTYFSDLKLKKINLIL